MRPAAAASALVEQDDAVARGIEEPPCAGVATRAGSAMQEERRLAVGPATFLPVDFVAIADGQVALAARLDRWIQPAPGIAGVAQDWHSS
jgi:hypothetical protein